MLSLPLPTGRRMWTRAFGPPNWAKPRSPSAYFNCEMDSDGFLVTCWLRGFSHWPAGLEILPEVQAKTVNEYSMITNCPVIPCCLLVHLSFLLRLTCFFFYFNFLEVVDISLNKNSLLCTKSTCLDYWNCMTTKNALVSLWLTFSLSVSLPLCDLSLSQLSPSVCVS